VTPTGAIKTVSAIKAATGGNKRIRTPDELMKRYQENVDSNALIIFPVSFLLFNIAYWVHYLTNWTPADLWS
jgi:hypothetical protein